MLQDWSRAITTMIPPSSHQVVDIGDYSAKIESVYPETSEKRLQDIAKDTYLCALYLPDNITKHTDSLDVIIKYPQFRGIDYLRTKIPR